MNESSCPVCGAPDNCRFKVNGWEVALCSGCGAGRTLPGGAGIGRDAFVADKYSLAGRVASYFGRAIEFERRYGQTLAFIRRHGDFSSCLDIGCGIGYWLNYLRRRGVARLAGIETHAPSARFAREVFGLKIDTAVGESSTGYALITLSDVLEHFEDPVKGLTGLLPAAAPGALFFVQCPNRESRMARRMGAAWPWWSPPDHLWHFTPASLRVVLEKAGLEVLEMITSDPVYDLIEQEAPAWIRPLLRPLRFTHRTAGYVRLPGGGSLIQVVARRNCAP